MRVIDVNGTKFNIRGLRLSEVSQEKFKTLGFGRLFFAPGLSNSKDADDKFSLIMDTVLGAVLGPDELESIDNAGGLPACRKVLTAIIEETYATEESIKNSHPGGNGTSTPPTGNDTAKSAEKVEKADAENASGTNQLI